MLYCSHVTYGGFFQWLLLKQLTFPLIGPAIAALTTSQALNRDATAYEPAFGVLAGFAGGHGR